MSCAEHEGNALREVADDEGARRAGKSRDAWNVKSGMWGKKNDAVMILTENNS